MRWSLFLALLAFTLPAAAADDLRNIQGQWRQVSVEGDGRSTDSPPDGPTITIDETHWIETSAAGQSSSTFTINPGKNPKEIDKVLRLRGRGTLTIPGIYSLDGDTLKVCEPFAFGGDVRLLRNRPTAFTTKPGDPFVVTVYERPKSATAWQSDWKRAFQSAREQHRLVFVDFFASWCAPCRAMETTVFRNPNVQRQLADFVLLRIDVDRDTVARVQGVRALPTLAIYDFAEHERFRMIGGQPTDRFSAAIAEIGGAATAFTQAADLIDEKRDVEAAFLVGNTYSRLRLTEDARRAYDEARKIARDRADQPAAQQAEALSAFTYAREGNPARAIKLLQKLAARPVNRDNDALISLTLGNAYFIAKDLTAAAAAYEHAQSVAAPESRIYQEARKGLAKTR